MSNYNDIRELKYMVKNLRVNELQEVLLAGRLSRIGRKQELIDRIDKCIDGEAAGGGGGQKAAVVERVRAAYSRRFGAGVQLPSSAQSTHPPGVALHGGQQVTPPPADPGPPPQRHQHAANVFYNAMPAPKAYPSYTAHSAAAARGGMQPTSAHYRMALPAATAPNAGKPTVRVDDVCQVRPVGLPFFDQLGTLLKLDELQLRSADRNQCGEYQFRIPAAHAADIARSARSDNYREPVALPRAEVQLRMFQLGVVDHNSEHTDEYPPHVTVKINEKDVDRLPPVIPSNKPGAEPRRYSRPTDITAKLHPVIAERPYRLSVYWPADQRRFAITLRVVRRVNSDMLMQRLLRKPVGSVSEVKQEIVKRVGAGDDDVGTSNIRVCIKDPMSMLRILTPVKGVRCCHLNCFDARSFLDMNEKRPTWKCPDCQKPTSFDDLRIDGYFVSVLKIARGDVTHVDLCADGGWKEVNDDSDDGSDTEQPGGSSSPAKPAQPTHVPSDEPVAVATPAAAAAACGAASGNTPPPVIGTLPKVATAPTLQPAKAPCAATSAVPSAEVEVIDLSDDEDDDDDIDNMLQRDVAAAIEQSRKAEPKGADASQASSTGGGGASSADRCTPPIACHTDDTVIMLGDSDDNDDSNGPQHFAIDNRQAASSSNGAPAAASTAAADALSFMPPPRKKMNISLGGGGSGAQQQQQQQQHSIQDQIRPVSASSFQIEQTNPISTGSINWPTVWTQHTSTTAASMWPGGGVDAASTQLYGAAMVAMAQQQQQQQQQQHLYGQLNPAQGPGAGAGRAYYTARAGFHELTDQFNQFAAGGSGGAADRGQQR